MDVDKKKKKHRLKEKNVDANLNVGKMKISFIWQIATEINTHIHISVHI